MSYYMIDVESDGECPGIFSMIEFGIVKVTEAKDEFVHEYLRPITNIWEPEALGAIGVTREETLGYGDPEEAIQSLAEFVKETSKGRPMFISDNNGFDWQFINYYCHKYLGVNPFGFSSTNLGSLYKGLVQDPFKNFKHLRDTPHTHRAIDDAMGNLEAFLKLIKTYNLPGYLDKE